MSMNKKELCEFIIRNFAEEKLGMIRPIVLEEIPEQSLYADSVVGIAAAQIGLIKDPSKLNYFTHIGGRNFNSSDEYGRRMIICFKEILDSVPDEAVKAKPVDRTLDSGRRFNFKGNS